MGIDLSGIVTYETKRLEDLSGNTIAIDAYNTIYQFLSIIRQPDGTPLMDRHGRITSHLSGLLYRTANVVQKGILPVFVFDGPPHPLKKKVIQGRRSVRRRAEREWKEALEAGDIERARTKAQQAVRLTDDMVSGSQELLKVMGIPHVDAPQDGEAQASHMASKGDVWAAGSQDYDSLLYGSPRLVKNLAISGRRKLPRRQEYVTVRIELLRLEENLKRWGVTREQLVDMAILIGTDFNDGVRGIGPKRALDLIHSHIDLESVTALADYTVENFEEIRKIFLQPKVTDSYRLDWLDMDEDGIISLLCDEHDFSVDRVKSALSKVREGRGARQQESLDSWM